VRVLLLRSLDDSDRRLHSRSGRSLLPERFSARLTWSGAPCHGANLGGKVAHKEHEQNEDGGL
jgi:hypothetical protein